MIIVEGPDGSGKSTLAGLLAEEIGLPLVHSGGRVLTAEDRDRRMQDVLDSPHQVRDRVACISEQVYGPVLRQSNIFAGTTWLYKLIEQRRPLIVYCRPPLTTLLRMENHRVKPEHEDEEHVAAVMENQERLVIAYDKLMLHVPCIKYDYTNRNHSVSQLAHLWRIRHAGA